MSEQRVRVSRKAKAPVRMYETFAAGSIKSVIYNLKCRIAKAKREGKYDVAKNFEYTLAIHEARLVEELKKSIPY